MNRFFTLLLAAFCALTTITWAQCDVADHTVTASSFMYSPSDLVIEAGESVAFVNIDGFHDVNGVTNSITGEPLNNPAEFSLEAQMGEASGICLGVVTFDEPGVYNYDCSIGNHAVQGMVGTITVNAPPQPSTVVDIIVASEDHTVLETAVVTAGLVDALSAEGPFTVFAPTDAAFTALLEALSVTADDLLAFPELVQILTYHVVGGVALSNDLTDGQMVTTLNGQEVTISIMDGTVMINGTTIVTVADIMADNGVVHVIEAVLIPQIIFGCSNYLACNFSALASEDDGSCLFPGDACDDGDDTTINDTFGAYFWCECAGEEIVEGCLNIYACNFNAVANVDDGSCFFPGDPCDDGDDLTADDVYTEDCECAGILIAQPGCTDGNACNYSPNANVNDGSCLYIDALGECGGQCFSDLDGDGICDDLLGCANIGAAFWQDLELAVYSTFNGNLALIDSSNMDLTLTVGNEVNDSLSTQLVLNVPLVFVDEVTGGAFQVLSWSNLVVAGLPPGVELILPPALDGASQACVELTGDDYPTLEGFYEVVITGEVLLNFFGTPFSIGDVSTSFWVEVVSNPNGVPGCTYPTASNYMPWATYDSGVCEFAGCTDPSALNYSPRHSVDDGSCFYNDPNCVADAACPEDLNGDGAVGTPDLLLMLGEYGNFCD